VVEFDDDRVVPGVHVPEDALSVLMEGSGRDQAGDLGTGSSPS
jgi:hypothetical protein